MISARTVFPTGTRSCTLHRSASAATRSSPRPGGIDVTRDLLDHILALGALRNVEIQLMPLVREVHAGPDGPMRLLETPENQWFGYCEGQRGGQFLSDLKEISVLQMRYAKLRSQALTPEDSVGLLERLRGAL